MPMKVISMLEKFTLWFPFELVEGFKIINENSSKKYPIEGYECEIKRIGRFHMLIVNELKSEEEARKFANKIIAGLYWFAIESITGFRYQAEFQQIYYNDVPLKSDENLVGIFGNESKEPIDGLIEAGQPAIYLHGKNMKIIVPGRIDVSIESNPELFFKKLNDGVNLKSADMIVADDKLKLGIDLYCLSHFQTSSFAKFLTQCTAIEVLAPSGKKGDSRLSQVIDRWVTEAKSLACEEKCKSVKEEFKALSARAGNLKSKSHRSRIREYVHDILRKEGDAEAVKLAKEAVELYDRRGSLVHDGKIDMKGEDTRFDEILRRVLKAAMKQASAV